MSRQVSRGSAGEYQADEQDSWLCTDSSPTRDREAGGGSQSLKGAISAPERTLIMGWFPCAAAVLGSPNAQGKPAQHIHLHIS